MPSLNPDSCIEYVVRPHLAAHCPPEIAWSYVIRPELFDVVLMLESNDMVLRRGAGFDVIRGQRWKIWISHRDLLCGDRSLILGQLDYVIRRMTYLLSEAT